MVRGGKSVAVLSVSQEDRLSLETEETELEDWIIASAVEEGGINRITLIFLSPLRKE